MSFLPMVDQTSMSVWVLPISILVLLRVLGGNSNRPAKARMTLVTRSMMHTVRDLERIACRVVVAGKRVMHVMVG